MQAIEAYERFPVEQRLWIRYEQLLENPATPLMACAELVSVKVDQETAERTAEKHSFQKYARTGTLQFRRHGRSGVWKTSENFTEQVRQVAEELLGPLRGRLGYSGHIPDSDMIQSPPPAQDALE
jgi:hypothetical protein